MDHLVGHPHLLKAPWLLHKALPGTGSMGPLSLLELFLFIYFIIFSFFAR